MAKHIPNTCGEEAGTITGQSPPRNTPARATDPWLICARERCLKKKQPRDVTSTMQTTMTITPVVRKFSSNRLFNASKQPCGQKRRWSGATEKEPTFATAFYLFERAAYVAWLRTAGRWFVVAPLCMVIYPTALELKPRGHSGDAGLWFLQRKSLGLTLVWIRSHSFIAFVEFPDFPFASSRPRIRSASTKLPIWWGGDSYEHGASELTNRRCGWCDPPVARSPAGYRPQPASGASGPTWAGKTAADHIHNPTFSI